MHNPHGSAADLIAMPQWIAGGPGLTIQERGVLAHMIATRNHGDGGDIAAHLRSPLLAQDDPEKLKTTLDGLGPVYSLNRPGAAF